MAHGSTIGFILVAERGGYGRIAATPFFASLLRLVKSASTSAYRLYIGVPTSESQTNNDSELQRLTEMLVELSATTTLQSKLFAEDHYDPRSPELWNILAAAAVNDGCDYIFKATTGVTLHGGNWLERYIATLAGHQICEGVGVVLPPPPTGYLPRQLFVSRLHFDINGFLFPPMMHMQFASRWMYETYSSIKSSYLEPCLDYTESSTASDLEHPVQLDLWSKSAVDYLTIMAKENLERWLISYSRTPSGTHKVPKSEAPNEVHLLVPYYQPNDPEHRAEVDQCLKNNYSNPLFTQIHLLTDQQYEIEKVLGSYDQRRIIQRVIGKRLSYKAAFNYASLNMPNKVCVLCNSDIYFDQSLNVIRELDLRKRVLALTRYEINTDEPKLFTLQGPCCEPNLGSQDVWIFRSPLPEMECDFELGQQRCDSKIAAVLFNNDLEISNPCQSIKCYHLHRSVLRKYDRSKHCEPPYLFLQHCKIEAGPQEFVPRELLTPIASLCTMATSGSLNDVRTLLTSVSLFEPRMPIVVLCDSAVAKQISVEFKNLNLSIDPSLDQYSGHNRQGLEQKGAWCDFMLRKCDVIERALTTYPNTLYVDADLVFLERLPQLDVRNDIYLSEHGVRADVAARYGRFNGGFIWVQNRRFLSWWKDQTARDRTFHEQYPLNGAPHIFKSGFFPLSINFGWWRAFLSDRPSLRLNQFRVGKDGLLRFKSDTLQSIHTHFNSSDPMTEEFNQFVLGLLKEAQDMRLRRIFEMVTCTSSLSPSPGICPKTSLNVHCFSTHKV